MQMDHLYQAERLDVELVYKKKKREKKAYRFVNFAVSADQRGLGKVSLF